MLHKILALALMFASVGAVAQNACIQEQAIGSRAGFSNLAQVLPAAQVTVNPGPIYPSASSSTPIAGNLLIADQNGNYNICATPATTQTVTVVAVGQSTLVYSLTFPVLGMTTNRIISNNNGLSPSCAFSAGGGSGASCIVDMDSSDSVGIMLLNTGTSPSSNGSVTLTFSSPLGTNKVVCIFTLTDVTANDWAFGANLSSNVFTSSNLSPIVYWQNASTNLLNSTTYGISYICIGK